VSVNADSPKPYSLPLPADQGQSGHRARLLNRYIKAGVSSLNDYEILELILTFALPRKDTKPLAKALIAKYGTVSATVNAPLDELCGIDGLGQRSAALFTLIKDTMSFCLNENFEKKPMIIHRGDIEEYLRFHYGHRREEFMAAIFLDTAQRVISTKIVAEGTVNKCVIYPRKIIDAALRCGAAFFILAHNHPSGCVYPSEKDWAATERLAEAGKHMDVPLIDHIIISKDQVVSMREFDRWIY
jgi:DNA repair protein RadC